MKVPSQVINSASELSMDFGSHERGQSSHMKDKVVKWIAPIGNTVKINTDAAFLASSGKAGLGFVIRNSEGLVMASGGKCLNIVQDVETAEALAILFGISMAWECGFIAVEIESDAISIIQQLQSPLLRLGPIRLIIEDILSKVVCFSNFSFSHINRGSNLVAHAIAQWALSLSDVIILMEDVPQGVVSLVLEDVSSLA